MKNPSSISSRNLLSVHRHAFVLRFVGDVDRIIHSVHIVILYHIGYMKSCYIFFRYVKRFVGCLIIIVRFV